MKHPGPIGSGLHPAELVTILYAVSRKLLYHFISNIRKHETNNNKKIKTHFVYCTTLRRGYFIDYISTVLELHFQKFIVYCLLKYLISLEKSFYLWDRIEEVFIA